jgi:hypothetical protein
MPRPLGDAVGERMELPEYYADFQRKFRHAQEFWKLERGQVFAEPGDASWEAFDAGDWDKAMRLAEARRADLRRYHEENAAAGIRTRRVRIVSLPVTAYLQWELHLLRLRDEVGGPIRILRASAITDLEDQGQLPDIYTMDGTVMYQDQALVRRCRDYIADLYARGEPIGDFFEREIAHLTPPSPATPTIPRDYLVRTGRPIPIRS